MDRGTREVMLSRLADAVGSVKVTHPTRVAVDGPPAAALSLPATTAPDDAVLVFDGVFLLRPELLDRWDLRIFVSTAFEATVARALIRERAALPAATIERRWRDRYIPSQEFYFATVHPADRADIVVHNDDPQRPVWEIRAG